MKATNSKIKFKVRFDYKEAKTGVFLRRQNRVSLMTIGSSNPLKCAFAGINVENSLGEIYNVFDEELNEEIAYALAL